MGLEKQVAKIGRLEELTTEAKESLVGAINEVAAAGGGGGGGSGALVVDFTLDEQTGTLTGTKTVAEVTAAMKEGIVVATFSTTNSVAPITKQPLGAAHWLDAGGSYDPGPFWVTIVVTSDVSISPMIGVSNGNWSMAS